MNSTRAMDRAVEQATDGGAPQPAESTADPWQRSTQWGWHDHQASSTSWSRDSWSSPTAPTRDSAWQSHWNGRDRWQVGQLTQQTQAHLAPPTPVSSGVSAGPPLPGEPSPPRGPAPRGVAPARVGQSWYRVDGGGDAPKRLEQPVPSTSDDAHLACVAPAPAAQSVDPTTKHDIDVADRVSSALADCSDQHSAEQHSEAADFSEAAPFASDDAHLACLAPAPAAQSVDPTTKHANDQAAPQMLALPSVCTFQEMQQMRPVNGIGGKAACTKQRDLRQVCLQNRVFEIDVTETWPEWRAVLRALPRNMQQLIIGNGIARVKFRLLEGVRDPNYAKKDSGERHVFEILRVDTSAVHLHYHKHGSLDDPVLVDPIAMPQNANSGASQPTAPFIALSPSQPNIGRREAVLALTRLLNACWNTGPGAVDITDGHAFDWKRFIANTMEHFEIAAMELEKVFALRTADSGPPQLALCTTGTTWKVMDPTQKNYKNTRLPGLRDMSSNWRTEPLLLQPRTLDTNWMRMR